ncbi:MAG: Hpt domain-containing protein [Planctomycetes bacterium]|nr:Hpt domain-containing protein [Planctomycetota bacterium]
MDKPLPDSTAPRSAGAGESPPAAAAALDWILARARTGASEATLIDLADILLGEGPRLLEEIRQAFRSGKSAEVFRRAHTLKSSAGVFCAQRASKAALRLETLAREERLADAEDALHHLEKELEILLEALRGRISEYRGKTPKDASG